MMFIYTKNKKQPKPEPQKKGIQKERKVKGGGDVTQGESQTVRCSG
jgi:hypothetical protein